MNEDKYEDFEFVTEPIKRLKPKSASRQGSRQGSRQQPFVYELYIKRPRVIKGLLQLVKGYFGVRGGEADTSYIKVSKNIYEAKGRTRTMPKRMEGAAHGFNKIFVAAEIPFFAQSAGDDLLRIGRISDVFDPTEYRTKWAKRNKSPIDGNPWYKGYVTYHEPTDYVRDRMREWKEKLEKFGIDFNKAPYSEEQTNKLVDEMPIEIKEQAEKDWEKYKEGEMEEISREEIEEIESIEPKEGQIDKIPIETMKLNGDQYIRAYINNVSTTYKIDGYVYATFDPKKHHGVVLMARGRNNEIAKNISQELQSKLRGTLKYSLVKEDIYKEEGALCEAIYLKFNFYTSKIETKDVGNKDVCKDKDIGNNIGSKYIDIDKDENRESWSGKMK